MGESQKKNLEEGGVSEHTEESREERRERERENKRDQVLSI